MNHVSQSPCSGVIPIKWWIDPTDIDQGAVTQATHLAQLPFVHSHIAIMPDTHQGYGMPIGAVMATKYVIIPNAVGVDIGCGMLAAKTSFVDISMDMIKKILGGSKEHKGGIRSSIPVGFNKHSKKQDDALMPTPNWESAYVIPDQYENARKSLGTLGGGNHFIEFQKGDDGHIWVMIHSGSRNLGKKIADYYNALAKDLNAKWHTIINPKWDLAFLPTDSEEGQAYIAEMNYAVNFAKANRRLMLQRVQEAIWDHWPGITFSSWDVAHNYAALEHHYGKDVWIHRKGATRARQGEIGIIPGSQGTSSYIVEGKGNLESFTSCSHGAGRKMGRKEAQRALNLDQEKEKLDKQGILHSIRGKKDLDEAPGAYKDIAEVMENQKDLVEIVVELKPLAVVKG